MVDYEKLEKMLLRCIALVGLNGLAFVYDQEWLPAAIGVDAMVLGFSINNARTNKKEAQ